ncbi:MAG: glycosyltransferase [Clostridiales bacterium]|nr:glycosyltransferase [Clostridiales bacterium]
MKTQPLISVIVPVFNAEKYLDACINSILQQTYQNLEIILVDDGSTDKSLAICDDFARKDTRIIVIYQPNSGPSNARNTGIKRASGTYLCFLDSDDSMEPKALQAAVSRMVETKADVVSWSYFADYLDERETLTKSVQVKVPNIVLKKGEEENQRLILDENTYGILGYAWNKLYQLEDIRKKGFYFEEGTSLSEDALFNFTYFLSVSSIACMDSCLTHYMQRPIQTLKNADCENLFALRLRVAEVKRRFFYAWAGDMEESDVAVAYMYFSAVMEHLKKRIHDTYRELHILLNGICQNRKMKSELARCKGRNANNRICLFLLKHRLNFFLILIYKLQYS